ncbi:FliH/SctL family protein [Neobacillus ginsengisoli]|nr:FliH/SctL family protein [Neobacillus ginsengisoli]
MKSYSKVFKSSHLSLVEEVKVITQPPISIYKEADESNLDACQESIEGVMAPPIQQLIEEAKEQALAIINRAEQNASLIESTAAEKINKWWEENKLQLDSMSLEAQQQGFEEGFTKGKLEAQSKLEDEYQGKLDQVKHLLQLAYEQKEEIISEAEPFLLELSTAIASQIVKQELESYPQKFVELIKQHILRFKEKERIIVCVHPDDFSFIQSQRAHLVAVVNGETEIKIIPDHSVSSKGCIIRTAYGSVDARIDTQIEEIKTAILEARRETGSGISS